MNASDKADKADKADDVADGAADARDADDAAALPASVHEPRLWRDDGWTARVIKNEDDDGWAVEMLRDGEPEPALVGPWTMGRDKKNPKPLDGAAFNTLVKTASEFVQRTVQQRRAALHRNVTVSTAGGPVRVTLDIVPDEDDPHAWLAAEDASGESLARIRVAPDFRLTSTSAAAWVESDFAKPPRR